MTPDALPATGPSFDDIVLPHLGSAHRLARWLLRNEHDAEDAVQDASLRALRYFGTFTGGNGRAWFMRIVRNTCYAKRGRHAPAELDLFDEEHHTVDQALPDPETELLRADGAHQIERAIATLPPRARDLLVLRELEDLSYQELAGVLDIPTGTVMSALFRARRALRAALDPGISRRQPKFTHHKESINAVVHGHSRAHSRVDRGRRRRGPSGRPQGPGEARRQVPQLLVQREIGAGVLSDRCAD
jgi:RNA polymerase sigma-70 factor (ECF subfamily)